MKTTNLPFLLSIITLKSFGEKLTVTAYKKATEKTVNLFRALYKPQKRNLNFNKLQTPQFLKKVRQENVYKLKEL